MSKLNGSVPSFRRPPVDAPGRHASGEETRPQQKDGNSVRNRIKGIDPEGLKAAPPRPDAPARRQASAPLGHQPGEAQIDRPDHSAARPRVTFSELPHEVRIFEIEEGHRLRPTRRPDDAPKSSHNAAAVVHQHGAGDQAVSDKPQRTPASSEQQWEFVVPESRSLLSRLAKALNPFSNA